MAQGKEADGLSSDLLIKQVSRDNLKDTDVVCLPGGRIKDVRDYLEALPNGYESITLLVGGNDCDITPPPSAAAIVATYGGLLDMAIIKARNVTVSRICPKMTTTETQQTIDAVNAGLLSMCDERAVKFVDKTPLFTLSDGSVNDGYLQPDGVHITRNAIDKIARNLCLQVKDTARGVCNGTDKTRRSQPTRRLRNQRGDDADYGQTVRLQPRNQRGDDVDDWQTVRRQPRSQRGDDALDWQTVRRQPRSNQRGDDADDWQTVRCQPRSNQRGDDADYRQTVRLQPRNQRGDDVDDWQTVRRQPRSQRGDDALDWQTVRRQPRSNQRGDDADDWQTVRLQPRNQRGDNVDDWQTVRRQPRSQRGDDASGWQTVRRQPRSNQPPAPRHTTGPTHTTCFFCGEGGHVRDNCRHGGKVECNSCHRLGHKAKFCTL